MIACDDETTTTKGPTPTLTLTSPTEGATVAAELEQEGTETELHVEIEFTVTNFTLAEPGKCGGKPSCGHVHVKVDGDKCNDTEEDGTKVPYNELVFASPAGADLLYCEGVTLGPMGVMGAEGPHVIAVQLFNDDHSAVTSPSGQGITDQVNVTVELEAAGGAGGTGGAAGAGGSAGGAGGSGGGSGGGGGMGGGSGGGGGN
jgi:hypothetical protein